MKIGHTYEDPRMWDNRISFTWCFLQCLYSSNFSLETNQIEKECTSKFMSKMLSTISGFEACFEPYWRWHIFLSSMHAILLWGILELLEDIWYQFLSKTLEIILKEVHLLGEPSYVLSSDHLHSPHHHWTSCR